MEKEVAGSEVGSRALMGVCRALLCRWKEKLVLGAKVLWPDGQSHSPVPALHAHLARFSFPGLALSCCTVPQVQDLCV